MYLAVWVGTENICSDDGSVGTLAVLDVGWSVITTYRGVFDLIIIIIMNINELSLSVPATVGRPLICAGADQLLTSDINPSVVTTTFMSGSIPEAYRFLTFKRY